VYQGSTTELIKLPEDSLAVQPSRLAILSRKYACAASYTGTARTTLVPGHVPDGYPNLKLFKKPEESSNGSIVTFSCLYYGYMESGDLNNPFLDFLSEKVETAAYYTYYTYIETSNNNLPSFESHPVSCIAPVVVASYITTASYPQIITAPTISIDSLSYLTGVTGQSTKPGDAYLYNASLVPSVSSFKSTKYVGITEVVATFTYDPSFTQIYAPRWFTFSFFEFQNGGGDLPYDGFVNIPVTYTISGAAHLTTRTVNGHTVYTVVENAKTYEEQGYSITAHFAGNIPSGYDFQRDYRQSNPVYYYPNSLTKEFTIAALPPPIDITPH
jgi:hypothetical protein